MDDMWEMPAGRFLLLAPRLEAYPGAVAARMNVERHQAQQPEPTPTGGRSQMPAQAAAPAPRDGVRVIGATAAEIGMSDIGDLFSHGVSGG
jgi:hypothetical protein